MPIPVSLSLEAAPEWQLLLMAVQKQSCKILSQSVQFSNAQIFFSEKEEEHFVTWDQAKISEIQH